MPGTALILGANGKFGRHAAEAFWNAGWQVRRHDRATGDLMADARGADVVVNGWNPPDYEKWEAMLPGLTDRVIAAAKASGATIVTPGNVYVYGQGLPARLTEDSPHRATNRLGRLRIETEAAMKDSGVQVIILRAGDFIDMGDPGWFAMMVRNLDKGRMMYPGPRDVPHAFAWLPDMARAAELLARKRDALGQVTDVNFPGYTLTGQQLAAHLEAVTGRALKVGGFPWLLLRLARPFWGMARGLVEMRYLWRVPHRLESLRLAGLLPEYRDTPAREALASTLKLDVHPDQPVARRLDTVAAQ